MFFSPSSFLTSLTNSSPYRLSRVDAYTHLSLHGVHVT